MPDNTQRRRFLKTAAAGWAAAAGAQALSTCGFANSFVTFVLKERANLARLQVESRCLLLDAKGQTVEEFFQFASCKAEHTYAQENLFQDPNYDFSGVFSRDHYVLFRAHAPQDPKLYAERGTVRNRFEDVLFQIREARDVKVLRTDSEKVQATLQGLPLIGRTEIRDERSGRRAVLEYPIKTMNVTDRKQIYQVDTGPIVFPDFRAPAARPVDMLELAYVAFNAPGEAYFILQRPTPLKQAGNQACLVSHYSEIRRMPAKNTVMSAAHI